MSESAGRSWVLYDASGQTELDSYELPLESSKVPSATIVDLSASYELGRYGQIYGKIDNLFDDAEIVSRRPYGARPGKPRQVSLGYKYRF